MAIFLPRRFEQCLRRRSLVEIATLIGHKAPVPDASRTARQPSLRAGAVQRQIQRQHIDAPLSENAERAALRFAR